MGFRDAPSRKRIYRDLPGDKLPTDVSRFYIAPATEVSLIPSNDPEYVNRHVRDILNEILEGPPLRPFVEGEAIGSLLKEVEASGTLLFGIPLIEYNRMSARVWADHKRLTAKRRRQQYETVRRQSGRTFRFVWHADVEAFRVQDITTLAVKENL
jgi:hypothetical protein